MKKLLLLLVATGLLSVILLSMRRPSIETPDYEVLRKIEDKIEIRSYPSLILAQTILDTASYNEIGNTGFRRVAGYIFGGNEKEQQISMTAPVIMELGERTEMAFVMPKQYSMEALPKPKSAAVQLTKAEARKLAVLRFGGYANDAKIQEKAAYLKQVLKNEGIAHEAKLIYMGYNAPWDFFGRRNEVAFELK
jgi:hypothetical protein